MHDRTAILDLLARTGSPAPLIAHVQEVERIAQLVADRLEAEGARVDRRVVEAGALLHDSGVSFRTGAPVTIPAFGEKAQGVLSDDILHPIYAYRLCQEHGFPEAVGRVALRHVYGPDRAECELLGVADPPAAAGGPETWEEKVVAFADIMLWARMLGFDPWSDPEALVKAGLPYASFFVERRTGRPLGLDSPWAERFRAASRELLRYVSPDDFPPVP